MIGKYLEILQLLGPPVFFKVCIRSHTCRCIAF